MSPYRTSSAPELPEPEPLERCPDCGFELEELDTEGDRWSAMIACLAGSRTMHGPHTRCPGPPRLERPVLRSLAGELLELLLLG